MVTSVNNLANKSKYVPVVLHLKKLRVASESYTRQSALKLLKIRTITDLITA